MEENRGLPTEMSGNRLLVKPFKPRVAELIGTRPPVPSTKKGRGTQISGNPKTNSIVYCSDLYVVILPLDNLLKAFVYDGHVRETTVARFSPDGDLVASADIYGTVQIWKTDGYLIKKKSYPGRIDELQWSPDGLLLMVCGSGLGKPYIRTFNWDSGCDSQEFGGDSLCVLSCDFSPNPPYQTVTCGMDPLVNVYDGSLFKLVRANKEHLDCVHCVRYSPSGDRFISVSSDQKGIIYDGGTGAKVGELLSEDENAGQIFSVSWSSDSKYIITASDNSANIWEITNDNCGILKKTLRFPGSDGMDMFVGCLWLNDNLVVVSLGGTISVFSAKDLDKPPWIFSGHRKCVNFVSCSVQSHQKVISSSSSDGTIMRWMPGIGYGVEVKRTDKTPIKCFAAVGDTIILYGAENKVKRILLNDDNDCREEENIHVCTQPTDLSIATQSCDLSLIATNSSVIILKGTTVLSCTNFEFSVAASTIAPDGREVIVGDQNGKLHIYSVKEDHTLCVKDVLERHLGPITVVKYSPNGYFFVSADALRECVVWVSTSHEMKLKNLFHHWHPITSAAWSPDSRRVATGSRDCDIMVYDVQQHPSTRVIIRGAHVRGVYGLAFTDDDILVSCGGDGCVRLWKMTDQSQL